MYNHLFFFYLKESPNSELGLPEKNTPSPFSPSSPKEFYFVHVDPPDFIFPDFLSKPMHEDLPFLKCAHVEYDHELFYPQQFDYGSSDDHSPTQEPCDEHIPEVLATSAIPSIIAQLRKTNKKIRNIKEVLR